MQFKICDVDIYDLDISKIEVHQTDSGKMIELQKNMSKAIWRPAPGRKLAFVVTYENNVLGLIFLASPVINMSARDEALGLSKNPSQKGKQLRNVADISVCVSSQPFGWRWNGGKLMAMVATTLGDFWKERYNDDLTYLVTTSLNGRGTQYNRVFKFVGYTKGFGHEHITDEEYQKMLQWMRDNEIEIPSCSFGAGSNPRMRRIAAYKKASGNKTVGLKHNKVRGIYIHEAVDPSLRQETIQRWFDRWGQKRFLNKKEETPPYMNGLSDQDKIVQMSKFWINLNVKQEKTTLEALGV